MNAAKVRKRMSRQRTRKLPISEQSCHKCNNEHKLVDNNFTCRKCGACCQTLYITITPEDLAREPKLHKAVTRLKHRPEHQNILGEYSDRFLLAAGWAIPCPMLGADNLCTIYETRPLACRQWQAEPQRCQRLKEKLDAAKSQNAQVI